MWGNVYFKYVNYLPDNLNSNDIYTHSHICARLLTIVLSGGCGHQTETANIYCTHSARLFLFFFFVFFSIIPAVQWLTIVLVTLRRMWKKGNDVLTIGNPIPNRIYLSPWFKITSRWVHGTAKVNEQWRELKSFGANTHKHKHKYYTQIQKSVNPSIHSDIETIIKERYN